MYFSISQGFFILLGLCCFVLCASLEGRTYTYLMTYLVHTGLFFRLAVAMLRKIETNAITNLWVRFIYFFYFFWYDMIQTFLCAVSGWIKQNSRNTVSLPWYHFAANIAVVVSICTLAWEKSKENRYKEPKHTDTLHTTNKHELSV